MSEIENQNVVEKPVQAQAETQKVETKVENTSPSSVEVQEQNWKKFREQREIERKQNEELQRRASEKEAEAQAMKAAMESLLNKNQPQQHYTGFDEEESEDQRIQKKVDAALAKERQRYEQERIEREKADAPNKIKSACPDFDKVVNTNNLDYLEFHYPEVANAFKRVPESVEKWQDIYHAVKRFVPQNNQKKEDQRLANNLSKPQSINTSNTLQGSTSKGAPIITEQQRAANWERMQRVIKGLS
jgi:hypothetical protein